MNLLCLTFIKLRCSGKARHVYKTEITVECSREDTLQLWRSGRKVGLLWLVKMGQKWIRQRLDEGLTEHRDQKSRVPALWKFSLMAAILTGELCCNSGGELQSLGKQGR